MKGMIWALLVVLAVSCGSESDPAAQNSNNIPPGPGQVYAKDWSSISIDANLAKTKITATGHFETDHNACNRPADGAMTLDQWNAFAEKVNEAVSGASSDAKTCFDADPTACLDGTAEIVRDDGSTIKLLEPGENGQSCVHVPDPALARDIFEAINGITYAADHTDCTLDYERCTK